MPKFNVHLIETVSTVVTVEADSYDEAMELAYDSPDMPGGITVGAFGQASVDEDGEWTAVAVSDENGEDVWREKTDRDYLAEADREIERLRARIAELEG